MKEVRWFLFSGIALSILGCASPDSFTPKQFAQQLATKAPTAAARAHWHWQTAQAHWRDGESILAEQSFAIGLKQARELESANDRNAVWPLFVRDLAQFDRWDEAFELADAIPLPTRAFLLHDLARPFIRANDPFAWEVMCHVNYNEIDPGPWAQVLWLDSALHAAWLNGGYDKAQWQRVPRLPRTTLQPEFLQSTAAHTMISRGSAIESQSAKRIGDPWPHRFRQHAWREVAEGWNNKTELHLFIDGLTRELDLLSNGFWHKQNVTNRILGHQLARAFLDANRPDAASPLLNQVLATHVRFSQVDKMSTVFGDIETLILLAEARETEQVITELPRLKQFRQNLTRYPFSNFLATLTQAQSDPQIITELESISQANPNQYWDEFGWIINRPPQHPQQIQMDARIAVLFAWLGRIDEAHAILDALNEQIRRGTRLGNGSNLTAVPLSIRSIDGLPVLADARYGPLRFQQADYLAALAIAYCDVARAERRQPRHVAARHKILKLDTRWKDVSATLGKVSEIESTLAHIGENTHDLAIAWQLAMLGKRPIPGKRPFITHALSPRDDLCQSATWRARAAIAEGNTKAALQHFRDATAAADTAPSPAGVRQMIHQITLAFALDPVAQTPRESFTPDEAALARLLLRKLR